MSGSKFNVSYGVLSKENKIGVGWGEEGLVKKHTHKLRNVKENAI